MITEYIMFLIKVMHMNVSDIRQRIGSPFCLFSRM